MPVPLSLRVNLLGSHFQASRSSLFASAVGVPNISSIEVFLDVVKAAVTQVVWTIDNLHIRLQFILAQNCGALAFSSICPGQDNTTAILSEDPGSKCAGKAKYVTTQ